MSSSGRRRGYRLTCAGFRSGKQRGQPLHMAGAVEQEGESLAIRREWAEAAARLFFLPAARMVHPAYALADEEAESENLSENASLPPSGGG